MTLDPSATTPTGFDEIPILGLGAIDGTDAERRELADRFCRICHEIGFLVVTDHGVDPSVVDDVFALMSEVFALDDADKARIDKVRSPHFRGWEAVGSEHTNNRVDVREQIDTWTEWPVSDDPDAPIDSRLLGPNQWLPDDVVAGHRDVTTRWTDELGRLADRLLGLVALGLGLDEDHFVAMFGDGSMSLTKMISYPATPEGSAGVNAHHDAGFITLLAPGTVAGLQVRSPHGGWIDVPIVPGAFVVNIGEMLQAVTANYLVATPHRVITSEPRMSAAYFHGPTLDTELTPLALPAEIHDAVAASPRHASAGFMASAAETDSGIDDMASSHRATTYGEQLWNYFRRSYPDNVARHHGDLTDDEPSSTTSERRATVG
ncbi:isopenicillin N synthase family dioxygenase [Ilumatobacter sp.]|uniref:isopenicillin N synthase family dioxygenase n=1 Tax=Ilumatobacter sp. TaxID=1967498 RepID=UPI003B516AA0